MLKKISVKATLLKCDFCGSIHASKKEAREHSCTKKIPKKRFTIGETVKAVFPVGAGIEQIGQEFALGKVIDIKSPVEQHYKEKKGTRFKFRRDGQGQGLVGFRVPENRHDWMVTVKPIEWKSQDYSNGELRQICVSQDLINKI
ncbi:MAG: hypothetical protein PHE59_04130 [Patescibacteria group bacterium]|nr:hypothetical protein [Patescibacteria group bacterium]MDD5164478.1 hypothetical protein [Patescibacteria group bacterium]MDD5534397.1 hypothetical protein [Patescibacteria group bacterium]